MILEAWNSMTSAYNSSILEYIALAILLPVVLLTWRFPSLLDSAKALLGYRIIEEPPKNARSNQLPLWETLYDLHKQHGPIVSVYQGGRTFVSLGTVKVATDLLEKRGNIYSSRPRTIMGDILTGGMRGASMAYGTRWRNWRSLMHAGLSHEASQSYKPLQTLESEILLDDLLHEEVADNYNIHFQRLTASIGYYISYGKRISSLDDPLVMAQYSLDRRFHIYSEPGRYIVDSYPWLLKLPHCLQWFRWEVEKQRKQDTALLMSLMSDVKERIKQGIAHPSIAKRGLEKQSEFGLTDEETAFALSSPFTASATTMFSVLQVIILAMLHYPHVMKKAQKEIDDVVGSNRMPDFGDEKSLPYITALIHEAMRWRPATPIAAPHSNTEDDTYDSLFIPKGCTVIPNAYAMSKDDEMFPSPEKFLPERYLGPGPFSTFYFGFGRRFCPGTHVASNSLYITVSRLLWAFDIIPINDKLGNPLLPDVNNFVNRVVRFPVPFQYSLRPRSEARARHIKENGTKAKDQAEAMWH